MNFSQHLLTKDPLAKFSQSIQVITQISPSFLSHYQGQKATMGKFRGLGLYLRILETH